MGALGRRFGGNSGIHTFGIFRKSQAVFLPTVYYCLEWINDYQSYVKSMQTHVYDCIRSMYRTQIKLPNHVLLVETAIPPVHIDGKYLQRRCYARMIDYHYCDSQELYHSIQVNWEWGDIQPRPTHSDRVLLNDFLVNIWDYKDTPLARHTCLIDDIY